MPESKLQGAFLTQLRASTLLSDEVIESAVWKLQLHQLDDDVDIARAMIKADLLTQYQAKQLLRGRGSSLVINGYRILYRLGAGGMGEVFTAEEVSSGWQVAIKILNEDRREDRGMTNRFQMEAEAGMKLAHPNLLRTFSLNAYESGGIQGHYVVMELVKGVSLRELISIRNPLSIAQACDIVMQSAIGLQVAHDEGMVHRDVKPENLLIRNDGAVKILDFGLALQDENDEEFTMAYVMGQRRLGTADYVAPEQIIDSYKVDCRADIYSLGCTLYFALTGKVPFPEESIREKLTGHCKRKPVPVGEFRDDVPPQLKTILLKMMAKHADKRISTATGVAKLMKPFAKREMVGFDFPQIVRARARLARKLALLRASRTGLTGKTEAPIEQPQAEADTMVRDDTDVNNPNRDSAGQ